MLKFRTKKDKIIEELLRQIRERDMRLEVCHSFIKALGNVLEAEKRESEKWKKRCHELYEEMNKKQQE